MLNNSCKSLLSIKCHPGSLRSIKDRTSGGSGLFRLLTLLSLLAIPVAALATQNLLDKSFAANGIATMQVSTSFGSRAFDAVRQSDGKIVVVGTGYNAPSFPNSLQATVIRYNTDGTLDTTFDGDGIAITTIDASKPSAAYAVTIQSDGKIVIVGSVNAGNSDPTGFIVRYNANGSLDTSFDGDGIKPYVIGATDIPNDVLVQTDGKILVAEANWTTGFGGGRLIARYNADGSTDSSFGTSGLVRFPFFSGAAIDERSEMALRPDGRIVYAFVDIQDQIVQLMSNGTLDTSFGSGGVVSNSGGHSIALQSDGKVVVSGRGTPNSTTAISRYNTDGSLDTGFGSGGRSTITFLNQDGSLANPSDVTIQADGKIVVGGSIRIMGGNFDFALTRLNASGSLDTSFAYNGRLSTEISGQDYGHAVIVQPDGKIVLAGESGAGFAVARYIPDVLTLSCRPVSDFDNDGRSDLAYYRGEGDWKFLWSSNGGGGTVNWGLSTDILVPADYNGDCRTDFAVYRNGIWYIRTFTGQQSYYNFGFAGDIPIPADYDGDDLADPAVFRNGVWYVLGSQAGFFATSWGLAGDIPVPGDYDGDGKEDIAIYRDGAWWLYRTTEGVGVVQFGLSTDKPVVGDYDGDGRSDVAVYRPSDGTWYLLKSTEGFAALRWGISTDSPVPADYDGDGKTDIAVYRNGDWYLLQSSSGYQLKQFGGATDRPIQGAYIP